jgi:magnesium transporter
MVKIIKEVSKTAGLVPGTMVHVGTKRTEKPEIDVIDYNETEFSEVKARTIEECFPFSAKKDTVTWINVDGVHDLGMVEEIGKHFDIHPLVLEDIVNTSQRPRYEDFGDYAFIIIKMIYRNGSKGEIISEQVSLVLGKNFVISFQEQKGDVFENIRQRVRTGKGRMRKMGSDYLAYLLLDSVVDNYFAILEDLGEKIEDIEEVLVKDPKPHTVQMIHNLKRALIFLRKSVWPLREVINLMAKGESPLVKKSTGIYLRDVYEHTVQVIDTVETFRDMVSGMLDIYLSSMSNRMNEIMKVLTMFAAIFIPLTFIAGIYGMNFKYMPELEWTWGYFAVLGGMAAVAATILVYFKRKKWF